MSSQLEQLLGYLERDGVTEVQFGSGRPIAMRKGGALTNITARPLSADQLSSMLRGSDIPALIPAGDGAGQAAEIAVGRRRATAQVTRRGSEIVVTLTRASGVPTTMGTLPIARVAAVPDAARATHTRAKAPTASTRAKSPTRSKSTTRTPRTKSGTALRVKSATAAPRGKSRTSAPRTKTPSMLAQSRTKTPLLAQPRTATATRPAGLVPPAPGQRGAAAGFDFSLDDGIELGAPSDYATPVPPPSTRAAFASDGSIDLGPLDDGGDLELELGTPRAAASEPPTSFDVDLSTNPPQPFIATPPQPLERLAPERSMPMQRQRLERATTAVEDHAPLEIAHAGTLPVQVVRPSLPTSPHAARSPHPAFATLVAAAREAGASDLHIAAARVTSIRVRGELVPIERAANPLSAQAVEELLLSLLDPAQQAQLDKAGYVDLALEAPGGGRLRANISRQQQGLKGTFRLAIAAPLTLDQLGLPGELAKVVAHHQGLVVIAGPSGHGKTTTLAALVDLLNSSRPYHILTIEDPVEIVHPRKQAVISQREAGRHTQSFARGLKASLREDPDVIVIGELRDRESVEIALTAAETGHLVIATMSTPSAAKTIDRLIDMFPPEEHSQVRASVAGALRAIVAQRLLPGRGGGIVPAIELVTGVLPLAVLIRDDKLFQLPNLMQRGRAFGMIRFDESLAEHVRAGRIDEDAALAFAESKKDLAAALRPPPAQPPPKTSQLWGFGRKGGDR